MYTLTTIGIVLYAFLIRKIYNDSGKIWKNFSPKKSSSEIYAIFMTTILFISIIIGMLICSIIYKYCP